MTDTTTGEHEAAKEWLASDDAGISSTAIVHAALGVKGGRTDFEPLDPADFGRCLRMLRLMPWAERGLPILAAESKAWLHIYMNWYVVEQSMLAEVGIDWEKAKTAPKTYALMRRIQDNAGAVQA